MNIFWDYSDFKRTFLIIHKTEPEQMDQMANNITNPLGKIITIKKTDSKHTSTKDMYIMYIKFLDVLGPLESPSPGVQHWMFRLPRN